MGQVNLTRKNVVIVGGGFSGTALAAQLLRRAPGASVAVIDRNDVPGRGLAYSTDYDCHRLNVPASDMSAFPDEPNHFLDWAGRNWTGQKGESQTESSPGAGSFLPRSFYGHYLGSLFNEMNNGRADFEWIRDEALSLSRQGKRFLVERRQGDPILTDAVVLATGNFPPGNLGISGLTKDSRRYVRIAWSKAALQNLDQNEAVLLIGSGLTSVDAAVALHSQGFKGKIHMLSRHGLLPQCHKKATPWPRFWNDRSPRTLRGLLDLIRGEVRAAESSGSDWRAVMDSLRPTIQEIWQSLSIPEQRRFLRHARPYWEIHRHRIAPEIASLLQSMINDGQVQLHSGRIIQYSEDDQAAEVAFRDRSTQQTKVLRVGRVINCSGPETNCRKIDSPFLSSLFEQGLVRQDTLALGLDVDKHGGLIDRLGIASPNLFSVGPLRKGRLWETTAVPDLRIQAQDLADHLGRGVLEREALRMPAENLATK
jgi:uncharacterized NAD(P)/FAD-binding protein YdhS